MTRLGLFQIVPCVLVPFSHKASEFLYNRELQYCLAARFPLYRERPSKTPALNTAALPCNQVAASLWPTPRQPGQRRAGVGSPSAVPSTVLHTPHATWAHVILPLYSRAGAGPAMQVPRLCPTCGSGRRVPGTHVGGSGRHVPGTHVGGWGGRRVPGTHVWGGGESEGPSPRGGAQSHAQMTGVERRPSALGWRPPTPSQTLLWTKEGNNQGGERISARLW